MHPSILFRAPGRQAPSVRPAGSPPPSLPWLLLVVCAGHHPRAAEGEVTNQAFGRMPPALLLLENTDLVVLDNDGLGRHVYVGLSHRPVGRRPRSGGRALLRRRGLPIWGVLRRHWQPNRS